MTVYEQGATCIIFVFIMAAEMNFANFIKGKVVYVGLRRCAEVGCGNEDVVDIKEEAAACLCGELRKKSVSDMSEVSKAR